MRGGAVNWLDVVLVLAAVSFAWSGYRQGFVVGALAFVGFLGGGAVGLLVAPTLVSGVDRGGLQSLLAVAVVLLAALVGQVALAWVGGLLRDTITWRPARVLDATLGALVSVVAMLLVSWFLASALRPGPLPALSREITESHVLAAVDDVMPDEARTAFSSFRRVLDDNGLPTVFGGLTPERIRPVEPPPRGVASRPQIAQASKSVVEIEGTASSCSRRLEGTGFVIAPQHVLTNAHVVAGVVRPYVRVGGVGTRLTSRVVLFDPERDVAVLYVPDLRASALRLDRTGDPDDLAVVAGFPQGGPYRRVPARIRDEFSATGADVYERNEVTRELFSLYADVEPGNSGGPLLSPDGDVYGVVFAKSDKDDHTGYALTADEVAPAVRAGRSRTTQTGSGSCV